MHADVAFVVGDGAGDGRQCFEGGEGGAGEGPVGGVAVYEDGVVGWVAEEGD